MPRPKAQPFANVVALVSPKLPKQIVALLAKNGAVIVTKNEPAVTIAVVGDDEVSEAILAHKTLRLLRKPTVFASWVHAVLANPSDILLTAAGTKSQTDAASVNGRTLPTALQIIRENAAYDPTFLSDHVITTSALTPSHLKDNVRSCVVYYGGRFEAALTSDVTLVIASDAMSAKSLEARARGIPCESLAWFEECVGQTKMMPHSNPRAAALAFELMEELLMLPPEQPAKRGGGGQKKLAVAEEEDLLAPARKPSKGRGAGATNKKQGGEGSSRDIRSMSIAARTVARSASRKAVSQVTVSAPAARGPSGAKRGQKRSRV